MIIFGAVYSVSFLQDDNIPPYKSYQVISSNTWNFALKVINDREKAEKMRANIDSKISAQNVFYNYTKKSKKAIQVIFNRTVSAALNKL